MTGAVLLNNHLTGGQQKIIDQAADEHSSTPSYNGIQIVFHTPEQTQKELQRLEKHFGVTEHTAVTLMGTRTLLLASLHEIKYAHAWEPINMKTNETMPFLSVKTQEPINLWKEGIERVLLNWKDQMGSEESSWM